MPFISFLRLSVNWQFVLCSYRKKREMQRPLAIDVSVLHLSTVIQLDDHTQKLSRFFNISSNSATITSPVQLHSNTSACGLLQVPCILSWSVDIDSSLPQCSGNKECVPQHFL